MSDYNDDLVIINTIVNRGMDEFDRPRPYTDEEFFLVSHQIGVNQFNSNYRKLFEVFSRWIVKEFNPMSSLEIGAGPGYLLYCLNLLGVNSVGVDGNNLSKKLYSSLHPSYQHKYFLDKNFTGEYGEVDLLLAIECFEHICDEDLFSLMEKISIKNKPKNIIFSSTPFVSEMQNWDIHWGHINIKSENEWVNFFDKYGYELMDVRPPVTEWALAFKLKQ